MGDEDRTLWVGNLSENVDEDLLYELFLQVRRISEIPSVLPRKLLFLLFTHNSSLYILRLVKPYMNIAQWALIDGEFHISCAHS